MAESYARAKEEELKFKEPSIQPNTVILAKTDSGKYIPVHADDRGRLYTALTVSDIEIGAVEIKDRDTDNRARVSTNGHVYIKIASDDAGMAKEHTSATDFHSVRITDGSEFIDPRDRNWALSSTTDSVNVGNFPADYPDSGTHTRLDTLHSDITSDQPRHITNAYDSDNDRFKVDVQATVNPPNLDVALSTRASETTLSSILTAVDNYKVLIDDTSTANRVYIGLAQPGTATSDAAWLIMAWDDSVNGLLFAEGEKLFNKIWDNRTAYAYS